MANSGPWWKDPTLWIQLCVQTPVFFLFTLGGAGLDVEDTYYIGLPDLSPLLYLGEAIAFIGLLMQRWLVHWGLAVSAVGLALVGASGLPTYFGAYPVVCFEAWYIVAFTRHYRWRWLTLLGLGSIFSLLWGSRVSLWGALAADTNSVVAFIIGATLLSGVSIALAALLGRETAKRNERMEMLAARAELATVSERNRIAREMHDIVAHSLTVVIAQADGGRYAGRKDPQRALDALDTIALRGRDALAQMRSLLSVLHDGSPEDRSTAVAPGVAGIPDLLYDAKRSGVRVDYQVEGHQRPLDEVRDLTAYRIVQESLTNVMKHAGAVDVRLRLTWASSALRIRVDNKPGVDTVGGSGRGLTGIAERVRVHGGSASWGPSTIFAGGWNVTATLPYA